MSAAFMREGSAAKFPDGGAVVRCVHRRPLVSLLPWAYTVRQVLPWSVVLTGLGADFLLPSLITSVLINWWEGVAWMGFVQARLQDRHGALLAAVIVAPLFALQHSSLVAGQTLMTGAVLLALLAVPFGFALGWSCNRTGSLFLVGLLHAVGNATTGGDGFNAGYLRHLYPGDTNVTMAHLMAMLLLGLLVVIATRGRLGHRRPDGPPEEHPEGVGMASYETTEES